MRLIGSRKDDGLDENVEGPGMQPYDAFHVSKGTRIRCQAAPDVQPYLFTVTVSSSN